jgi:uncharacterized Zn finger protein (UPF0148 family)
MSDISKITPPCPWCGQTPEYEDGVIWCPTCAEPADREYKAWANAAMDAIHQGEPVPEKPPQRWVVTFPWSSHAEALDEWRDAVEHEKKMLARE